MAKQGQHSYLAVCQHSSCKRRCWWASTAADKHCCWLGGHQVSMCGKKDTALPVVM